MADDSDDDTVGYGRPPQHSQFKSGQSGNPGGRPRGSKSWKTVIEAELGMEVSLKEQGVENKVTKLEALAKRLVADALSGNSKALSELLRQVNQHLGDPTASETAELPASEDDLRLLLKYAHKAVRDHGGQEVEDDQTNNF
jgi:hypothetical protein